MLANFAEEEDLVGLVQNDSSNEVIGKSGSHWVILARSSAAFGDLAKKVDAWPGDHSYRWRSSAAQCRPVDGFRPVGLERRVPGASSARKRRGPTSFRLKEQVKRMSDAEARRRIQEEIDEKWKKDEELRKKVGLWTDDFSNLLSIFEWGD